MNRATYTWLSTGGSGESYFVRQGDDSLWHKTDTVTQYRYRQIDIFINDHLYKDLNDRRCSMINVANYLTP